jgi:hypothetical protein
MFERFQRKPLLGFIEPCLPTAGNKPRTGPEWVHEIKHDGYRLLVRREGDRVRLFTRRGSDWSKRYPPDCGRRAEAESPLVHDSMGKLFGAAPMGFPTSTSSTHRLTMTAPSSTDLICCC